MLAGTAVALGLWNLFNLVFIGGAMTAIDPDELDHAAALGIGTGIGSVLAPLIAMFIGGVVAGRLASHFDRKVAAGHGALVWALSSVIGLVIMATVAGNLVDKRMVNAHAGAMSAPAPGTAAYVDDQVRLINQHLKSQSAPTIETSEFLDAARYGAGDGRTVNRDGFVSRLDANTDLSRPEAEAVLDRLGDDAPDVLLASQQLAIHREQALEIAEGTGNALLSGGVALFLCLATAMGGALIGAGLFKRNGRGGGRGGNRDYDRPDTIPGPAPATPAPSTTATYPATPQPMVTPASPDVRRDPLE